VVVRALQEVLHKQLMVRRLSLTQLYFQRQQQKLYILAIPPQMVMAMGVLGGNFVITQEFLELGSKRYSNVI
jgi:hypothetical protein